MRNAGEDVNVPASFADYSFTVGQPTSHTGTVRDPSSGNDPLTYAVGTAAAHGTLELNANGTFRYTPLPYYHGADSFSFTVTDSVGNTSDPVPVNVGVNELASFIPTPPIAVFVVDATATPNQQVVRSLYRAILGREADGTGLTNWTALLDAGAPVSQVVAGIWNSKEHREKEVKSYYLNYLGRDFAAGQVSQAEVDKWVNAMLAGSSEASVVAGFLGSTEYAALHPGNQAFVQALYADVLGRTPSQAEVNNWVSVLAGGVSHQAVAQAFLGSAEASDHAVEAFYNTYLMRLSDSGKSAWVGTLTSGTKSLGGVAREFLASQEFVLRAKRGF